jgi:hypothetical protein
VCDASWLRRLIFSAEEQESPELRRMFGSIIAEFLGPGRLETR